MKLRHHFSALIVFGLLLSGPLHLLASGPHPPAEPARKAASPDPRAFHRFIPNAGQWDAEVRYMSDLVAGRLWLRETGFTFSYFDVDRLEEIHDKYLHAEGKLDLRAREREPVGTHVVKVDFVGAKPGSMHRAEGPSAHFVNFFLGNDPSKWATGLRAHASVHYEGIWPGIGMDMYSVEGRLKYDFRVEAGADPGLVRMRYRGAEGLRLEDGALVVETSVGDYRELRPYAYQAVNGAPREVPCAFVLEGDEVRFSLPAGYDPRLPLVIDPTLEGATYSGSSVTCFGHTATYDDLGNIYAGGICFGTGFPTTPGAAQTLFGGGGTDHGINKYNPNATALIWSTYIGGSDSDYPHSMVVNNQGQLVVLGSTRSSNFPTSATAAQPGFAGGFSDITITVLNAAGTGIVGSTYLGGSGEDGSMNFALNMNYGDQFRGEAIVDAADNIYIASCTESADFPVTAGVLATNIQGTSDGVVAKLTPNVSTVTWATFLGGMDDDCANSLKLNSAAEVYVVGGTNSTGGFPVGASAMLPTAQGQIDGFVVRLSPNASTVLSGTYLGGPGDDHAYFVELDANGVPYVLGNASAYPVSPGVYVQPGGGLFIDKLTANLSASSLSTTLGWPLNDLSPTAFLVDICGNIYASAWGTTDSLPTTPNAFQPQADNGDFYLITLTPNMSSLLYATNFGGSGWEHVDGGTSRFDKRGVVYQASCSSSPNWPATPGAVFPTPTTGSYDVVSFKFAFQFLNISSAFALAQAPGGCAPYAVTFVNQSSTSPSTFYHWDFGTGDTDTAYAPTYVYQNAGTYTVTLTVTDTSSCMGADTATLSITINPAPPLQLTVTTGGCNADSVQLNGPVLPGATYQWSPAAGLSSTNIPNPVAAPPGGSQVYTLSVTDSAGCTGSASIPVALTTIVSEAGPPTFHCAGSGGAQLQASAPVGGTAPYYYQWWCGLPICGLDSVNDDNPLANPTASTWYYLQVTDFNGCLGLVDSVWVEVRPRPLVDAGPDAGICPQPAPGTLITATVLNGAQAPGPYTVQWMPANGLNDPSIFSPFARPDTTTIYAAVVTSANGCSSEYTTVDTTSTITVTVHPLPVADAGPEQHLCLGDSLLLPGMGLAAGPAYDFQWSPATGLSDSAIGNPMASPPFTHTYSLVVWSNGCPSHSDTVRVNVHTLPTPSAGNIVELCLGEAGQLDAFGAGDSTASYTYLWTPGAGLSNPTAENPTASPDSTTQYAVVVTSSWGCESEPDSVLVRLKPTPLAEAGPVQHICEGQSLTLPGGYFYTTTDSAPPSEIYYAWTPAATLSDSTVAQPLATPGGSQWYHLTVIHNTCSTTDSVLVVMNPTPVPVVGADTLVACEGVPVQLHAAGGINADYLWSPAQGLDDPSSPDPVANPGVTTTYVVTVTEAGCAVEVPLTLSVIPAPSVSALSSAAEGCVPLDVSFLEASHTALAYVWDFGDGSPVSNALAPSHRYTRPGTYTVRLMGVNTGGCTGEAAPLTVVVGDTAHPDFSVAAEGQAASDLPLVLELPHAAADFRNLSTGSVAAWTWDFGDGIRSDQVHPGHAYTEPGTYYVTLRAQGAEGCMSTRTRGPIIVMAPGLFIPNVFSPNGDGTGDRWLPEYTGSQPILMEVMDRWGAKVHAGRDKLMGWDGSDAKGNPVPEGVYYYRVVVGEGEYVGHLTLLR